MYADFPLLYNVDNPNIKGANALAKSLADDGVKNIFAVAEYLMGQYSVGEFLLRNRIAVADIKQRVTVCPIITLEAGVSSIPSFCELALNGSKYICVRPPYGSFSDETMLEFKNIIQKLKLVPIIFNTERYIAMYEEKDIERLLSLPLTVYHFSADSLNNSEYLSVANELTKANKRVIVGRSLAFNEREKRLSPGKSAKRLIDYLEVVNVKFYREILGSD